MRRRPGACRLRLVAAGGALVLGALLPGCAVEGVAFQRDDRLTIAAPGGNEAVRLPFDVRWELERHDGLVALFFDRSPMPPGEGLDWLVSDDDPCSAEPGCPDADWLEAQDVYVTDDAELVVHTLRDRRSSGRSKDRHELALVFLDRYGRRLGEAAFLREFFVERED